MISVLLDDETKRDPSARSVYRFRRARASRPIVSIAVDLLEMGVCKRIKAGGSVAPSSIVGTSLIINSCGKLGDSFRLLKPLWLPSVCLIGS